MRPSSVTRNAYLIELSRLERRGIAVGAVKKLRHEYVRRLDFAERAAYSDDRVVAEHRVATYEERLDKVLPALTLLA